MVISWVKQPSLNFSALLLCLLSAFISVPHFWSWSYIADFTLCSFIPLDSFGNIIYLLLWIWSKICKNLIFLWTHIYADFQYLNQLKTQIKFIFLAKSHFNIISHKNLFSQCKKCLFNVLITGESNFDKRNGQLPRVSFVKK